MPRYPNGQIPESELYIFNRGQTVHKMNDGSNLVENWYQGLTPGTYAKHLALVALAKKNTGNNLRLSEGFSCYRPIYGQTIARILYGIGAAKVGTSSHGGWWENKETMAMDYGNWSSVYSGNRDRFYADCRAVGLAPGLISKERGYPDEPWHVIDLDPWRAVPAGGGARPFDPVEEETEMKAIHSPNRPWTLIGPGYARNLNDEEAGNTVWPKVELNDRQYDLNVSNVTGNVNVAAPVGGMVIVKSPGRPTALIGAGYYRALNAEEEANAGALAVRVVSGNDRQFDLWTSIALAGSAASFPVKAEVDIDYDAMADAIVARLPEGAKPATAEEIAAATRELFRSDPLK